MLRDWLAVALMVGLSVSPVLLVIAAETPEEAKPSFVVTVHPPIALEQASIGGAPVRVRFAIKGEVNEEWYCPRLDVTWPDGTKSMREADCDPWPDHVHTGWSWSFERAFPSGEYKVRGCLSKAGHVLACTDAIVRVVG